MLVTILSPNGLTEAVVIQWDHDQVLVRSTRTNALYVVTPGQILDHPGYVK